MLNRDEFEHWLRQLAASDEATPEVRAELAAALKRLDADPSLRLGDPNGVFTYGDPVLAIALNRAWSGSQAEARGGHALTGTADLGKCNPIWIWTGLQDLWHRGKKAFRELKARIPAGPVDETNATLRLALVGDAGFKCNAQKHVLEQMVQRHRVKPFDYVVHLGDTYFGGGASEVLKNLLMPFNCFRREKIPAKVVNVCGNHDLYYGPDGYVAALEMFHQPGRFFLVRTPHWRLAVLDTALEAYSFGNYGKLDKAQLAWLKEILGARDRRPLVLLSHHYPVSAWESTSRQLAAQLRADVPGKVFAWYWGHEHRMVAYQRHPWSFYGACVGNGVFPEAYSEPKHSQYPIAWYPRSRCRCDGRSDNWPHGYLEVELRPEGRLWECYRVEGEPPWERTLPEPQPATRSPAEAEGGRARTRRGEQL